MQRQGVRTWIATVGVASLVSVGVGGTAHADGIGRFNRHDLVSDVAGRADLTDPNLVNVQVTVQFENGQLGIRSYSISGMVSRYR